MVDYNSFRAELNCLAELSKRGIFKYPRVDFASPFLGFKCLFCGVMYIKKRNLEHGRTKRNSRKPKSCETLYSTFGTPLKLLIIWALLLMVDHLTDFRFEFLYSCWMFLRTVIDSFRYQGLAFALLFTLFATMSDLVCYFIVPTSLLYLLGSSFVWVQLVWQSDRGCCWSMMIMCSMFVCVEITLRSRSPKHIALGVDFCRPFAAHSVGYPAVTLGFVFKTMLSHHFRSRQQRTVEAQNLTFFALLEEAIPKELRLYFNPDDHQSTKMKRHNTASNAIEASPTTAAIPSVTPPSRIGSKDQKIPHNGGTSRRQQSHASSTNPTPRQQSQNLSPSTGSSPELCMLHTDQQQQSTYRRHSPSTTSSLAVTSASVGSLVSPDLCRQDGDGTANPVSIEPTSATSSYADSWSPTQSCLPDGASSRELVSPDSVIHSNSKPPSSVCSSSCSTYSSSSTSSIASSTSTNAWQSQHPTAVGRNTTTTTRTTTTTGIVQAASGSGNGNGGNGKSGGDSKSVGTNSEQNGGSHTASAGRSGTTGNGGGGGSSRSGSNGGGPGKPGPNAPGSGSKSANKDEYTLKLEAELKQLKSELQSLRGLEADLRTQVQQLTTVERTYRAEISQARLEYETLQAKLTQMTERVGTDQTNLQASEERLAEERKQRALLEQQLSSLQQAKSRQMRKEQLPDGMQTDLTAPVGKTSNKHPCVSRGTCTVGDVCGPRVKELEAELRASRRELTAKEQQLIALKDSRRTIAAHSTMNGGGGGGVDNGRPHVDKDDYQNHQQLQQQLQAELINKLQCLQEENQRMSVTLKEEDKMKQDLMTAYHSSLKEVTELNASLTNKEFLIVELNRRLEGLTPQLYEFAGMMQNPIAQRGGPTNHNAQLDGASTFGSDNAMGLMSASAYSPDAIGSRVPSSRGIIKLDPHASSKLCGEMTFPSMGIGSGRSNQQSLLMSHRSNGPSGSISPPFSAFPAFSTASYVPNSLVDGMDGISLASRISNGCGTVSHSVFTDSGFPNHHPQQHNQNTNGHTMYSSPPMSTACPSQLGFPRPTRTIGLNSPASPSSILDMDSYPRQFTTTTSTTQSPRSLQHRSRFPINPVTSTANNTTYSNPLTGTRPLPVGASTVPSTASSPSPYNVPPPGLRYTQLNTSSQQHCDSFHMAFDTLHRNEDNVQSPSSFDLMLANNYPDPSGSPSTLDLSGNNVALSSHGLMNSNSGAMTDGLPSGLFPSAQQALLLRDNFSLNSLGATSDAMVPMNGLLHSSSTDRMGPPFGVLSMSDTVDRLDDDHHVDSHNESNSTLANLENHLNSGPFFDSSLVTSTAALSTTPVSFHQSTAEEQIDPDRCGSMASQSTETVL